MARKHPWLAPLTLAALALLAAPAARGALVAWWPMNDGSGTTVTDTVGGNHGTITGEGTIVTWVPGGPTGGSALNFDGSLGNGYITIPAAALASVSGKVSIGFWQYGDVAQQPARQDTVFEATNAGGRNLNVHLPWSDSNIYWDAGNAGTATYDRINKAAGSAAEYEGQWNYWTFTKDAASGVMQIHLNGQLWHSGSGMTRSMAGSTTFRIGSNAGGTATYEGALDDFAVWNHALSPIDIRSLASDSINPTQVSDTAQVSYRITVSSPSTNARLAAFVNDAQQGLGVPFYVNPTWDPGDYTTWYNDSGTAKTITASGSLAMRTSPGGTVSDWLQVAAAFGTGTADQTQHPYMAATFTAPAYHVFDFGGGNKSQVLTSNTANWIAGSVPYTDGGYPNSVNMYEATSPNPPVTSPPFAPGTEAIWAKASAFPGNPFSNVFFATEATLVPGNWQLQGDPVTQLPGDSVPGLSGLFVRQTSGIASLDAADTTLLLRRGSTGHDMSEARTAANPLSTAHIDTAGDFAGGEGVLAAWRDAGGSPAPSHPLNIAAMIAGYVHIPASGSDTAWSFAVFGDDDAYMRIGDTEWTRGAARQVNTVVFPSNAEDTYWPILVVSRNATTTAGIEVSAAQATWDAGLGMWVHPGYPAVNMAAFSILGTVGAPDVYTRDAALGSLAGIGGEGVGSPTFAGTFAGADASGDGVYARAVAGTGVTNTTGAINWLTANPQPPNTTPAIRSRLNINQSVPASTGAFPNDDLYPGIPSGDPDNISFVSRSLFYSPGGETVGFAVGSDDGFRLQLGNRVVGSLDGGRGITTDQNMMYAYFDQPGLYKMELYHYEGTSSAGIEMSYKVGATLLQNSRNPNTAGYQLNLANRFHTYQPKVEFAQVEGVQMWGKAWVEVSGVAGAGSYFPSATWSLQQLVNNGQARVPGLLGTYYNFTGLPATPAWPEGAPVQGTRTDIDTGVFYRTSGFTPPFQADNFGVKWTGYLLAPATGYYNFQVRNDDRGWMFIDIDGNGVIDPTAEGMPGQPQVWANWMSWNNVFLTQGLHAIDFRMREFTGGEEFRFQWQVPGSTAWADIPAAALSQNIYDGVWGPVTGGTAELLGDEVGGLLELAYMATFPMDWDNYVQLRLTAEFFGMIAITEGNFLFIPEPGTMVLLAGGLLAAAHRRRQRAKPQGR